MHTAKQLSNHFSDCWLLTVHRLLAVRARPLSLLSTMALRACFRFSFPAWFAAVLHFGFFCALSAPPFSLQSIQVSTRAFAFLQCTSPDQYAPSPNASSRHHVSNDFAHASQFRSALYVRVSRELPGELSTLRPQEIRTSFLTSEIGETPTTNPTKGDQNQNSEFRRQAGGRRQAAGEATGDSDRAEGGRRQARTATGGRREQRQVTGERRCNLAT